jgi:hypothetical protein
MIYKFKSKAGADVIMLGDSGEQLLCLLGREPSEKGLLAHADLGAALAALEAAVARDEADFAQQQVEAQAEGLPIPRRAGVSLRQRAWPLQELMRHALKAQQDIFWGV